MNTKLYELWHFPIEANEYFEEDERMISIGIYSSKDNAKAAIERLKGKPGFRDWPNGFRIFRRTLDKDSWAEGFSSIFTSKDDLI